MPHTEQLSRRRFLKLAGMGGGCSLVNGATPSFLKHLFNTFDQLTKPSLPSMWTAFEPFGGRKTNSSSDLAFVSRIYPPTPAHPNYYKVGLPVNKDRPREAAELLIDAVKNKMPNGGVLLMSGEDASIAPYCLFRIEDESSARDLNEHQRGVTMAPSAKLYDLAVATLESSAAHQSTANAIFHIDAHKGKNTAGGYICEILYTLMLDFARSEFEKRGAFYYCLFLHVSTDETLHRFRAKAAHHLIRVLGEELKDDQSNPVRIATPLI